MKVNPHRQEIPDIAPLEPPVATDSVSMEGIGLQQNGIRQSQSRRSVNAFEQNMRLGRGINLGNALEAPNEGEWGVVLQQPWFQLIREAGFKSVRIPIRWSAHAEEFTPYSLDHEFAKRVAWAVNCALQAGLRVIINMHHYDALTQSPQTERARFQELWFQIAHLFQRYDDRLLFELYNEPSGELTSGHWNDLLAATIPIIRETNPDRTLLIGTANWGGIDALEYLNIPEEEKNVIVTVHYYSPFPFTHQGAEWVKGSDSWLGTRWKGGNAAKEIRYDLWRCAEWGRKENRPMHLGEFGTFHKADFKSRIRWTKAVAREAENYNMSWAYWEFCAGFGLFDAETGKWNQKLLEAVQPSPAKRFSLRKLFVGKE